MTTSATIAGRPVTATVLEGLTIRYGRDRVDDQVPPSSCTLQLLTSNADLPMVNLRDGVRVTVDGVTVFAGKVTDRTIDVPFIDSGRVGTITTVIATGPLAELGRVLVGATSYPLELDGVRVQRILDQTGPSVPAIDTIPDAIALYRYSFDYWAATGIDTVDSGTAQILARTGAAAKASDLAGQVVTSVASPGVYETADGRIGYSDARRRSKNTAGITLDAGVLGASLTYGNRVGQLVNTVAIQYGNPQTTTTVTDTASVALFGPLTKSITTSLAHATDATDLAYRILTTRVKDVLQLETVTVRLDDPNLPPATKAALTGVKFGTPITLTGLDTRLGLGSSWRGFVEGWTLTARNGREALSLAVSARVYSLALAEVLDLSSTVNRLEGTVNGLAELWAPNPLIDAINYSIDSQSAVSIDRAYSIP